MPSQAPSDRVAVLPQQPAPKVDGATVLATPNPPAPASAGGGTYTVVAGDTLHGISRKTGASAEAIKQANGLSSGLIRIGQKLTIPTGGASTPRRSRRRPRSRRRRPTPPPRRRMRAASPRCAGRCAAG
jgi:LysM repeat protein